MQRYIDADALMQKYCNECGVKDREHFCRAHCGDKMMIEEMPTADVEPIKGWMISVKERLPEEDGKYMVWYRGEWYISEFDAESQTFGDTYIEYKETYSYICWDDSIDKEVTHWMPLPEPPKGE